ncbi:MAG: helix-turn-helix domain-containing protein, partial [Butyrivibrio sp.]|nr:helix-turn-helix domain-containing protein [Butyrivibrio sp.]
PERAEAVNRLKQLIAEDVSQEEIMKKLKISKRTYYRYKKELEQ